MWGFDVDELGGAFNAFFFPFPPLGKWSHLSLLFGLKPPTKWNSACAPCWPLDELYIALLLCNRWCHHYKNWSEIHCVIYIYTFFVDSCTQLKIFLAYLKKTLKISFGNNFPYVFFLWFPSYLRTFQKPKPSTIGTQEGKEGEHLLQLVLVTRTFCRSEELHLVFSKAFLWVSTFGQGHVRFSVPKKHTYCFQK